MNDIFRDLLDVCVIVYLDDILVYSKNKDEHEQHLRQVLQHLKDNQLYARLSKCTFFTNSIEYLGHIVDGDDLRPNPQLVQALMDFPQPRILKELQSFLGLANYYRKFIANFSQIALSLTDATRNNTQSNLRPIEWTESMQTAFDPLKESFDISIMSSFTRPGRRIRSYYGRLGRCEGSRSGINSERSSCGI